RSGRFTPSPSLSEIRLCSGLVALDHDPALVLGDRRRLLDEHLVADLVHVVLVMRLVALGHTNNLLHNGMREAPFDFDNDRLLVLVADDGALQNALWHDLRP